jgi:hypothetical protein
MSNHYVYQKETIAALSQLLQTAPSSVQTESACIGFKNHEPLLVILDSCIRYAKAHQQAYEGPLGCDSFAAPHFEDILRGVRGLLNCQGGVALEQARSTDSKDNGLCEGLFWAACEAAGLEGEEVLG